MIPTEIKMIYFKKRNDRPKEKYSRIKNSGVMISTRR
jgi:hypothetical protein